MSFHHAELLESLSSVSIAVQQMSLIGILLDWLSITTLLTAFCMTKLFNED